MDFTNLEEKAREAKLDYGEAESLVRFFNFQRERRGEPPVSADYGRLCEQLSEIYPDVEFNLAGHRIVARVKSDVSGSLVDRIGFVSSHIPHLTTTIGFGSEASRSSSAPTGSASSRKIRGTSSSSMTSTWKRSGATVRATKTRSTISSGIISTNISARRWKTRSSTLRARTVNSILKRDRKTNSNG